MCCEKVKHMYHQGKAPSECSADGLSNLCRGFDGHDRVSLLHQRGIGHEGETTGAGMSTQDHIRQSG